MRDRVMLEPNDLKEYQEIAWCRRLDEPPLSAKPRTGAHVRYATSSMGLGGVLCLSQTRNTRSISASCFEPAGSVPNAAGGPAHKREARKASADVAGP